MIVSEGQATQELHKFIDDCDGDLLAAIYEYVFAHVTNAVWDDAENHIEADHDNR